MLLADHLFPVAKVGAAAWIAVSFDSVRVISSLTFVHLNSSGRIERGSWSNPCSYLDTLLKQQWSPNHFLTEDVIIISIFSILVSVRSYMVSGHIRGSNLNCRHQLFNLLGNMDLSMTSRELQ